MHRDKLKIYIYIYLYRDNLKRYTYIYLYRDNLKPYIFKQNIVLFTFYTSLCSHGLSLLACSSSEFRHLVRLRTRRDRPLIRPLLTQHNTIQNIAVRRPMSLVDVTNAIRIVERYVMAT
jgi:hypothetical protein